MVNTKTHSLEELFKEHEKVIIHPLSNIFPPMAPAEFSNLVDDIKKNGVLEPIWIYEGRIIDGRHRFVAATENNIGCPEREYTGNDPVGFIISINLKRRHLNESQRAMIAVKLATMKQGARTDLTAIAVMSQPHAAKSLNVSVDSLQRAKKVGEVCTPEDIKSVENGKLTVTGALRNAAKEITRSAPILPSDTYRIIYADPPWKYGNSGEVVIGNAEDQYSTMTIKELCDLEVVKMADDNAVLFMWVTSPLLAECFDVIKAWGFQYKTSFVWNKDRHNFGFYNSVQHEFLLVCTRGSCTPDIDEKIPSVQTIKRTGKHSEKPEEFRTIIDRLYTKGKRIELFRRGEAPEGWDIWGAEADAA